MFKNQAIKIFKIIVLVAGIIYIWNIAPYSAVWTKIKTQFIGIPKDLNVAEGDFIFQNIHGGLFRVIKAVTGSELTHCGLIVKKDDGFYVLEAIGPVILTPLNEWIHRGIGSKVKIVRLKAPYQPYIPKIIEHAHRFLNFPYDIQYEWDDDKIYCSELIYKAAMNATKIPLANLRKLGEMNWQPYEGFIRAISGGQLPLDREIITPMDLAESDKVEIVYSNIEENENIIDFLKKKGIPGIFNACEAIVWFILAGVFYFFNVFNLKQGQKQNRVMSALLIFFGISDIIEIYTGAWWRPWWLFLWKAVCLLGIGFTIINFYLKRQQNDKEST